LTRHNTLEVLFWFPNLHFLMLIAFPSSCTQFLQFQFFALFRPLLNSYQIYDSQLREPAAKTDNKSARYTAAIASDPCDAAATDLKFLHFPSKRWRRGWSNASCVRACARPNQFHLSTTRLFLRGAAFVPPCTPNWLSVILTLQPPLSFVLRTI